MKLKKESEGYEVGYKRPPSGTQFKKGQSGNPKGKPKAVKNLGDVIVKELFQFINVREGEKTSKCMKLNVLVKRAVEKGLKGDLRATKYLFDAMERLKVFERPEFRSQAHEAQAHEMASEIMQLIERGCRTEWKYEEVTNAAGEDAKEWMLKNFEKLKSLDLINPKPDLTISNGSFAIDYRVLPPVEQT